MNKEFVNNFNDYLRKDTNTSYNNKYLDNRTNENSFNKINYSNHFNDLLKKNYGNNILIEKDKTRCLSNDNSILDTSNYKKTSCLKSDINSCKYSNSPFEFDNYYYLN